MVDHSMTVLRLLLARTKDGSVRWTRARSGQTAGPFPAFVCSVPGLGEVLLELIHVVSYPRGARILFARLHGLGTIHMAAPGTEAMELIEQILACASRPWAARRARRERALRRLRDALEAMAC
jgi:hypothetical protein